MIGRHPRFREVPLWRPSNAACSMRHVGFERSNGA